MTVTGLRTLLYYIYVVDAMSTLFLFGKQDILISTPTQLLGVGGGTGMTKRHSTFQNIS